MQVYREGSLQSQPSGRDRWGQEPAGGSTALGQNLDIGCRTMIHTPTHRDPHTNPHTLHGQSLQDLLAVPWWMQPGASSILGLMGGVYVCVCARVLHVCRCLCTYNGGSIGNFWKSLQLQEVTEIDWAFSQSFLWLMKSCVSVGLGSLSPLLVQWLRTFKSQGQ